MMGCLKFPRVHLFWDRALHVDIFPNIMSCERVFQLRNNLCIVNLLEMLEHHQDKIHKVHPLIDATRQRCVELSLEQNQ